MYEEFENFDFVIKRTKPFVTKGRRHTKDESIKIDKQIESFMDEIKLPYNEIESHDISRGMEVLDVLK